MTKMVDVEDVEMLEEIEDKSKQVKSRAKSSAKRAKKTLEKYDQAMLELLLERVKNNQERLRIFRLSEQLRQVELENLKLQSELLSLKSKEKEKVDPKIVSAIEKVNSSLVQATKAKDAFAKELIEKYEIADPTFGFDPETGEIVEQLREHAI